MATVPHRQQSVTGRTCCICDRPCAIFDCQCLENFQHNTSEHGNLMKRLTAAFSMPVSAKDLHSFGLCCSCEHHLVVIEQANRIKECIKQVFIETREHRRFVSNHMMKHGKPPTTAIIRQKRLSSAIDSRSFDEASPRVKRSRVASSSSFPITHKLQHNSSSPLPPSHHTTPSASNHSNISFDESQAKLPKVDMTLSFDSVFLPGASTSPKLMCAPPDKSIPINNHAIDHSKPHIDLNDSANNMEYEEQGCESDDHLKSTV